MRASAFPHGLLAGAIAGVLALAGAAGCQPFAEGRFALGVAALPAVLVEGTPERLGLGHGVELFVSRGPGVEPKVEASFPLDARGAIAVVWHESRDAGGPGAVSYRASFGGEFLGPARWGNPNGFWRLGRALGFGVSVHGVNASSGGEDAVGAGLYLRPGLALWGGKTGLLTLEAQLDGWVEARSASLAGTASLALGFAGRF